MQHLSCLQAVQILGKHLAFLGQVPDREFPRQEQTAQYCFQFGPDRRLCHSAQKSASDSSTPAPTEKQIITEHDHWTIFRNLVWAGLFCTGDNVDTQHVPHSHTCEEAEPLIWATPVSHAVCFSRKRHNRETQKRHAMSLKLADRVSKRKQMAQPEQQPLFRRTNAEKQGAKH